MKPVKMYYDVECNVDFNCVNKCPFEKSFYVGSVACRNNCKCCVGSGSDLIWLLSEERSYVMNGGRGWVYCSKTFNAPPFSYKVRRFFYVLKICLEKVFKSGKRMIRK